ncbi:MAG: ral secretion pathway protein [Gaiellaceae bacterium]|nr:ral secretion pathway protein [Gaiellaceae bacterium]
MSSTGTRGRAAGATVARQTAERYVLPFVDLRTTGVVPAAAEAIEARTLVRANAMPYAFDGERLLVAISDPGDVQAIDELRLATRRDLGFAVAAREDIELELRNLERQMEATRRHAVEADEEFSYEDDLEVAEEEESGPLVKLVNSIVYQAVEEGASDVHFLPQPDGLYVRLRVDGVLRELERIPRQRAGAVISRIKVLAKLDIAEHRRPQDGRISLRTKEGGQVDIRVSLLPAVEGEGAILRLLDKSRKPPTMTEIGLSFSMQMALEQVLNRPTGALLVTGPTGSGKSTTLYAALADLARPEVNAITIEDPVEYRLPGIYQLQVNQKIDFDFAKALRAVLRSDPDVVMVGEIRDRETAAISMRAALTGHFVLSTLHTNDAPSAITRLTEMGVEPFVIASGITAVLAQRLARRLCEHCRESYEPTVDELEKIGLDPGIGQLWRPASCDRCTRGYRGRVGIFQLLPMTDDVRRLTAREATSHEIEAAGTEAGMRTLWEDGVDKVLAGLTTVDELRRTLL